MTHWPAWPLGWKLRESMSGRQVLATLNPRRNHQRLQWNHAGARDPVVTNLRNITADATPNANQNAALATVVATRNWLCNSAGASDNSTAGWGAGTKCGAITITIPRIRIPQLFCENTRKRPIAVAA